MRYIDKMRAIQNTLQEVFPVKSFSMSNDDMSDEKGLKDVISLTFYDGIPQELQDSASGYMDELRSFIWDQEHAFYQKVNELDVKHGVNRG